MHETMTEETVATGVVHEVPDDMRDALVSNADALEKWNGLTPLARNEWICWTTIVKQAETRKKHIERLTEELLQGKRRPCCFDRPYCRSCRPCHRQGRHRSRYNPRTPHKPRHPSPSTPTSSWTSG